MGHFTVVYSVTGPMNGSDAAGDLVSIQTSLAYHANRVVLLTSLHLHNKTKEVCIKTRSPAASLPAISQVTQPQLKNGLQDKLAIPGGGGGGLLPYISYIGMCRPKGYGFRAILV